jgi:transcriptional regulator with XRE-family HTH domain
MVDPMTPGARLRAVREGLGKAQEETAAAIGIHPTQISRHENDRKPFATKTALRYAEYFGVDVDYLLCRDINAHMASWGEPPPADPTATPGTRLRELRAARGFKTRTACARLLGVNHVTMMHHEMGLRQITARRAQLYADFFRVPASYILYGENLPTPDFVALVGTIEAGGRVIDMPPHGSEVRQIPAPVGLAQDLIAYAVIGDDLYPSYFHGDVVMTTRPNGQIDAIAVNNRECIVTTASNEHLIRIVKAEEDGRFSIFGPHGPPQTRIRLKHAVPVLQINRGQLRNLPRSDGS